MRNLLILAFITVLAACGGSSKDGEQSTAPGALAEEDIKTGVWFIEPADGASVNSPVTVKMGVSGMEVEPAGMVVEGKGHHHLIIDGNYVDQGVMVPADSTHIHYGQGQTEVELDLTPGQHSLTMQFADGVHTSYGEEWSATITVNVEEPTDNTNQ